MAGQSKISNCRLITMISFYAKYEIKWKIQGKQF